jgi:hypothetical protein
VGVVEDLTDAQADLLVLARPGEALDLGDEDVFTERPPGVEFRGARSVRTYHDALAGQVLDERSDRRLVRRRRLVETAQVQREITGGASAGPPYPKRTAENACFVRSGRDGTNASRARSSQLQAWCGPSPEQRREPVRVHDADMPSTAALGLGVHERTAVDAAIVGHDLAGQIAVDDKGDLV